MRVALTFACLASLACAPLASPSTARAEAGIDALNARLSDAYRRRDPDAYAALFTDSAAFEWPAYTARGHAALAAMVRANWAAARDVDLTLRVASRQATADRATEFGGFEQTWTDTAGVRRTEFGRYATYLVRQRGGTWRMERFLGFEDSTRAALPGR